MAMKVLTNHFVFERSSNIWLFYKSMLQTWKSIVLVSSRIWPFTLKLDTQHLSFLLANWLQFNFILHFSLPKKSNHKIKNLFIYLFNHFSKKIRRVLNSIQRIYLDNYKDNTHLGFDYIIGPLNTYSKHFYSFHYYIKFDTSDIYSLTWI